ncbi:sensor histidine kinase [Chitinophaga agrisoli]|uniref:Oxygen sensor histidine kinase NreB n=1 Tax=Chitinophaga agrisoli TaxID=2607653 RepID=A0A5B2VL99_9BACT|nr:ATP-binding protein [Chitinophaga agrisoli]KAA2239488.1 sensor histidine kinase [Chitinophaga agrisoli]
MGDKILYTTAFVSLLIAIIIIFFVVSIITYHRRYIRLQRERITAEITILENERKRIATDLHDSAGPLLSTVKLIINSIEVQNDHDRQIVQRSSKYIDDTIRNLRQISHNLLPNALERKGLIEATREFIQQVTESQSLQIDLRTSGDIHIQPEKSIHIFRIIQEIVQNTLKHAQAHQLQISLSQEDGLLLLYIREDGAGFDVKKAKTTSTGLGMKSLEIRTDIMRGSLVIESSPGQGTNYLIKIPA